MYQLYLARDVDCAALGDALGTTFGIAPDNVHFAADYEDFLSCSGKALICHHIHRPGEFPLTLDLLLQRPLPNEADERAVAQHLARCLDATILVDDGAASPYTMLLIDSDGGVTRVPLDDRDGDQSGIRVLRRL